METAAVAGSYYHTEGKEGPTKTFQEAAYRIKQRPIIANHQQTTSGPGDRELIRSNRFKQKHENQINSVRDVYYLAATVRFYELSNIEASLQ